MSDDTDQAAAQAAADLANSTAGAPFIYFDSAPTYGVAAGAIQIELTAGTIIPAGEKPKTVQVMTAHLRCSPAAALHLKSAIEEALKLFQQQQQGTAVAAKLN
jgi:hypothetical protein